MTHPPYLDTLGIWAATAALPEQIGSALTATTEQLAASGPVADGPIDSVVFFGGGGSGAAVRLAAAYGDTHATVPVRTVDDDLVPAHVGPDTLVVAVSHSGEANGVNTVVTDSVARGARVVVVTDEGSLRDWAASNGITCFTIPDSLPAARVALGAMAVPLLLTMSHAGLIPDATPSLTAVCEALSRRRDSLMAPGNSAEVVARRIGRTIPLVYGSSGVSAVAARRWKTQINENAKTPSFFAEVPELSRNEIAGWGQNGDVTRQVFTLVALRHSGESREVARCFELVLAATDEVMGDVITVQGEGKDDLTRFFDLALFGDFVSLHLAGREGTDPGPVPAVDDVAPAVRAQ